MSNTKETNNNINEEKVSTFKKIKRILNYLGKILSYASISILVIIGMFLVYYLISMQRSKTDQNYKPLVSLYTIISGSMEPTIHVYDVVVNTAVTNPEDIKVGDVITFISTSYISEGLTITHRVQDIKIVNGKYEFVTKGDNNPVADGSTAKFEDVIGKVKFKLPQLGRIQFLVASKAGWFLVVLLPAMGVIIYDVIKLIKLLATKSTADKLNNKKKISTNQTTDKALDNIKKSDNIDDTFDKIKEDIAKQNLINDQEPQKEEKIKVEEPIEIKEEPILEEKIVTSTEENNISKDDFMNRLNALKNKQ